MGHSQEQSVVAKGYCRICLDHKIGTEFATAETDKLSSLLPSFHESGGKFAIDPLLLTAQGYQESGFDQKMRNASGAVGVMQIKPSTAREKQIAINDVVGSASNNIKGGGPNISVSSPTPISTIPKSVRATGC